MAEPMRTARTDAQMNKAKLKLKQIEAQARAQRIKHMMHRPQPRVVKPPNETN
ncbi:MAG: hypothetical protein HQL94_02090 [Magnetococcales bacterium]|nr:hypothetical protein [Magnetococcales bacterium]MBF0439728.1 hypothetical protein [Magnetococcales bacterium]